MKWFKLESQQAYNEPNYLKQDFSLCVVCGSEIPVDDDLCDEHWEELKVREMIHG